MNTENLVNQHYGFGQIMQRITSGLTNAGKDLENLSVDDLAPIDAFHTRGRHATLELAELANIQPTDLVLDVGCGLGGAARHLAETYNCNVNGIDLTHEYIQVGIELTRLVNLGDRVHLQQASALDLPFDDDSFDVVWTEHVQMNIADKHNFYAEIVRVLKPGGRFLFHDIFRGTAPDEPVYPAPWAEDQSISHLAIEDHAQSIFQFVGLDIHHWISKVDQSLEFFKNTAARIAAEGPPPIGIHLLMGDNASAKIQNYVQNLSNARTTVSMGLAHKPSA